MSAFARTFVLLGPVLAACANQGLDPDPKSLSRSFYLGFSGFPPKIDFQVAVQALEAWTRRADMAIVHEELPWTELLAGVPPDTILAREKDGLIGYYRGKGLKLVFIADANDGLSRGQEAPRLRAAGRSIADPAIQAIYRQWILAFVRRYQPEYVGVAAETNLIRIAAPPALYRGVVEAARGAATALRALAAPPKLFVSVQVETAWGRLGGQQGFLGVERDFQDFAFIELLGLSSYPYFGWSDPADLPNDYYRRLLGGRSTPVLVVEGGWASASALDFVSDPIKQRRYFERQAELLADLQALAWLSLAPTDLDLPSFPADLRESLRPFASLGVLDIELRPKPALAVWDSLFALPRR